MVILTSVKVELKKWSTGIFHRKDGDKINNIDDLRLC